MKLDTHLNFGGNGEEAFRFCENPGSENAVIHARMNVAGVELIGNDVPPDRFEPVRSSYL
jgi:PhnB protein